MKYVTDTLRRLAYVVLFPLAFVGYGVLFLAVFMAVIFASPLLWLFGGWATLRTVWLAADPVLDFEIRQSPIVTVHEKIRWILP